MRTAATLLRTAAVTVLVAMTFVATPTAAAPDETIADFDGRPVNLAQSWEGAGACYVGPAGATCFGTEAEMDQWLAHAGLLREVAGGVVPASTCSSYVRLYDGTSYTGAVLHLSTRHVWHNLAGLGFDQRTSSYKIGACSALFADLANGGGGTMPSTYTAAWKQYTSMPVAGWNDDVSSVYIY